MKVFDIIKESSNPTDTVTDKLSKFWKKNERLNQRTRLNIEKRWGPLRYLLTALKIAGPALVFAVNYQGLLSIAEMPDDEFEKFVGVPASEKNQWVSDSRDLITAQFVNAYIMGGLLMMVKYLPGVKQLLTLIASALGIALTKGKGGALVAGAVIFEQAAITAFMVWAASTEGSKWLANNVIVAAIVKTEGTALTSIWDGLVKKFYEVTNITPPKPDAIHQATDATSTGSKFPTMGAAEYSAAKDAWYKQSERPVPDVAPLGAPYKTN